jgi:L-alanine-DL-glutamate epimerase-like enolase superfamily enzyme
MKHKNPAGTGIVRNLKKQEFDSGSESRYDRREFLKMSGIALAGIATLNADPLGTQTNLSSVKITNVIIENGVVIKASDGTSGMFKGSPSQDLGSLGTHLDKIRELLIGKDPLDRSLDAEMIWEAIYPGRAKLYSEGKDPLTGELIAGKPRKERHTSTGRVFMAFSTVDNALWDLRGKLMKMPVYQLMGDTSRKQVPVYWRPGEATEGLDEACKRAREAFNRGFIYQKWYWNKGARDGKEGFKENIELVRRLREELPEAHLMIDNHSIRYDDDVGYSVELCKAVAEYKPYWIEEPICPEHVEGYCRIKEETGVPIAGGEHLYTRWPVRAFLDRKCLDFVQSDPIWCGGISEWLKICEMARQFPGVKVVPHITNPWTVAPHCVASQSADLCPLLEYNVEGGRDALADYMNRADSGEITMTMPGEPGI